MMKRNWLTTALVVIALTIVAACGGSTGESGGAASPTDTPASASPAPVEENRLVESAKGEVSIPANPERVVGLSVVYPELLYALGIVPAAVQNYHDEFPSYLEQPFKDTVKTGIARTPNFEAILNAEPDLIIAPVWWSENDYDQLTQIAPTVLLPQRDDWRDELRDIAAIFGKEELAEKVINDLKAKEAEASKKLDELVGDETVLYMRVMAKEVIIHGENIDRGSLIHKQLGLKAVDNFPQAENAISISLEVLPEYDADHLIVQLDDEANDEVRERFDSMLESSIWKGLTAVKEDHVYMVGGKEWFNVGMSPLADRYAIDTIVAAFEEKSR
jgi:iron complex transport system substrate-binding protein